MAVSKAVALNVFGRVHNNLVLGLTGCAILQQISADQMPAKVTVMAPGVPSRELDVAAMKEMWADPVARNESLREFERGLRRSALREAHEVILSCVDTTPHLTLYQKQSWYQFARAVRHILSHKQVGAISAESVRSIPLPASWRDMSITQADVGKEFQMAAGQVLALLNDMEGFLKSLPD